MKKVLCLLSFPVCILSCMTSVAGFAKQDGATPRFYPARFGQGVYNNEFQGGAALPVPVSIDNRRGTVELWITLKEDLKPYYGYRTLFSIQNITENNDRSNCISLIVTPKDEFYEESLKFTVVSPQGKRNDLYLKYPDWKKGEHHHIAATWGEKGMQFYFDGKLVASHSYRGGFWHTGSFLSIGRLLNCVTTDSFLLIDEVRISATQKSAEEIAGYSSSSRQPAVEKDTLALCRFNGNLAVESNPAAVRKLAGDGNFYFPFKYDSNSGNVFNTGEDVALNAIFVSALENPGEFDIKAVVRDFNRKELWRGVVKIRPQGGINGAPFQIKLPFRDKVGWYSVSLDLLKNEKKLASRPTSFMVIPKIPQGKYTLAMDASSSVMPWEAMAKCGYRLTRMHHPWKWPMIEYAPGKYDFSDADRAVKKSQETGIKILGILGWVPLWEAQRPDNYNDFIGKRNERNMTSAPYRWRPKDLERYRQFLNMLFTRYSGKVHYYEHYNEPDWHLPGGPGCAFGGTTKQFFDLMKVQYEEMKKCDPRARMLFPGISGTPEADWNFVPDLLKMGALKYFDIVGMHCYAGYGHFQTLVDIFRENGYKGPVWQSERFIDPDAYKMQVWDILKTMGRNYQLYVVHEQTWLFLFGHPQPHAFTISYLYHQVGDKECTGKLEDADVYFFTNGKEQMVAACGQMVKLQTGVKKLIRTDIFGRSETVTTNNGRITLGEEIVYLTPLPGEKFDFSKFTVRGNSSELLKNGSIDTVEGDPGMRVFFISSWEDAKIGRTVADDIVRRDGRYSMRLEAAPGKIHTASQKLLPGANGKKLELSAWVRTRNGEGFMEIRSASTGKSYSRITWKNAPQNGFSYRSIRFTLPENVKDAVAVCGVAPGNGKVWFDRISLREQQLPLAEYWTVFPRGVMPRNTNIVPASLDSTKGGKSQPVSRKFPEDVIDLGTVISNLRLKDQAILFNEFDMPEAVTIRGGASADWWMEIYVNGKQVCNTLRDGNGVQVFNPNVHTFDMPLRKGKNVVCVRVIAGSEGCRLAFGKPAEE